MRQTPLADRMRPVQINDLIGQEHIFGPGKLLRRMVEADTMSSIILYGPPGTGKTSIASVIANSTNAAFCPINATNAGKTDMKKVIDEAIKLRQTEDRGTILFIDEIHRFNKAQQDYLLPYVEQGVITLVGATTENPYFEVNSALLSRSSIFELKPLTKENILEVISRALTDPMAPIQDRRVLLDYQRERLSRGLERRLERERGRLAGLAAALDAMSPLKVLGRGYAIARKEDGTLVRSRTQAAPGEALEVRVSDGALRCRVEETVER